MRTYLALLLFGASACASNTAGPVGWPVDDASPDGGFEAGADFGGDDADAGDAGFAEDGAADDAADGGSSDAANEPYRQVVLDDDPVAYLRLGESSPSQPATDEVPSGPEGTYAAQAVLLGQPGAIIGDPNTALDLSGGCTDIGNTMPFYANASFSIEAWVQSNGSSNYQEIVVKRDYDSSTSSLYGYDLVLAQDGTVCVQRWNGAESAPGTSDSACSTTPLASGVYTHVVATYDSSTLALYVAGALAASTPSTLSLPVTTSSLHVGNDPSFAQSSFNGLIDEVAIYDHALTPARVAAHTLAGSGQ
jgi:Concanavalin A-like lectin/glucanases superfamily